MLIAMKMKAYDVYIILLPFIGFALKVMRIVSLLPVDRHYKGCDNDAQCAIILDYTLRKSMLVKVCSRSYVKVFVYFSPFTL